MFWECLGQFWPRNWKRVSHIPCWGLCKIVFGSWSTISPFKLLVRVVPGVLLDGLWLLQGMLSVLTRLFQENAPQAFSKDNLVGDIFLIEVLFSSKLGLDQKLGSHLYSSLSKKEDGIPSTGAASVISFNNHFYFPCMCLFPEQRLGSLGGKLILSNHRGSS